MKTLFKIALFLFAACSALAETQVRYYATAVAAGTTTTETAITLTRSTNSVEVTTTGTSFVIPANKRFHIESITFTAVGNTTATTSSTTFSIRVNAAGAVTTSSTPIVVKQRLVTQPISLASATTITYAANGFDLYGDATGTATFGLTANAVYVTNAPTWDVLIVGTEL